jgi:predicted alpha/beta hydrolase
MTSSKHELSAELSPAPPPEGQTETLVAADGYRLTALRYRAVGRPQGRVVVAGATGVPQRFYRRFAQHAAAQGFETLTLDYRGIGLSRPAELRGFEMDYRDWARLDLAAAVDACAEDGVPLFMVGHSYGGHAFGLLPNHARVDGLYTFATGAGWHGWMPPLERLRVLLMWRVLGPVLTRWKGYLPWSLLGMGEDLPLGVYRQWRHWCQFPRYFFDDPEFAAEVQAQFAAVRTPIVAANALDDHWAPPASRDAFMAGYRQAGWRALDIAPVAPLGPIGHMGYFRPAAQALWAPVLAWFSSLPACCWPRGPSWSRRCCRWCSV